MSLADAVRVRAVEGTVARRAITTSDGEVVHVAKILRRSNRLRFWSGLVLLVVVAAWGAADARDIGNVLHGVEIVNGEEFAVDVGARHAVGRWISVTADMTVPSGLVEQRTNALTGSAATTARYSLMRLGHQVLVVRTGRGSTASSQEGIVTAVPLDVATDVVDPLRAQGLQVLPVLLDAARPYRSDVLGRMVSLVLFGLAGLCLFLSGLVRSLDHARHPIVRNLTAHGDPQETAFVVEDELASPHLVVGALRFTRSFVVRLTRSDVAVARLDDVVFAYTTTRLWIPVVSFLLGVVQPDRASLYVYDRDGWVTRLRTRDGRAARAAIAQLEELCPWAVIGAQYRTLWKKDRSRFLAAVEQRRRAPILSRPPDAGLPLDPQGPAPMPSQPLIA